MNPFHPDALKASNPLCRKCGNEIAPGTASAHAAGHCMKHVHVAMPGGGHATVAHDCPLETVASLRKVVEATREITALHRIVSDDCRQNRGDASLPPLLAAEIQTALGDALEGWPAGKGTKFVLKLIISRENSVYSPTRFWLSNKRRAGFMMPLGSPEGSGCQCGSSEPAASGGRADLIQGF